MAFVGKFLLIQVNCVENDLQIKSNQLLQIDLNQNHRKIDLDQ